MQFFFFIFQERKMFYNKYRWATASHGALVQADRWPAFVWSANHLFFIIWRIVLKPGGMGISKNLILKEITFEQT